MPVRVPLVRSKGKDKRGFDAQFPSVLERWVHVHKPLSGPSVAINLVRII